MDQDSRLVVGSGGEDLTLLRGDDSIAGDELSEDSAGGLDTKGEGVDVYKENLLSVFSPREDTTLNGGTVRDSLIRVDSLRGLLAIKELLEELLNLGDTSRSTNENDLSDD